MNQPPRGSGTGDTRERCPTCGSPDPHYNAVQWDETTRSYYRCSEPFHTPNHKGDRDAFDRFVRYANAADDIALALGLDAEYELDDLASAARAQSRTIEQQEAENERLHAALVDMGNDWQRDVFRIKALEAIKQPRKPLDVIGWLGSSGKEVVVDEQERHLAQLQGEKLRRHLIADHGVQGVLSRSPMEDMHRTEHEDTTNNMSKDGEKR